MVYIVFSR